MLLLLLYNLGFLSDRFGRIFTFRLMVKIVVISGMMASITNLNLPAFVASWFFVGFSCISGYCVIFVYLVELFDDPKEGQWKVLL